MPTISAPSSVPTCPSCGHQWGEWWRSEVDTNDDAETEIECGSCTQPYVVTVRLSVRFASRPGRID
jgi:DNA-directed RNA polymerase subunit M/transcription elongation factor TFIIS